MRILVVEDDRKHREELSQTLGRAKGPCPRCVLPVTFEVETADSVKQARKYVVERGYDFVLVDVNMAGSLEASRLIPLLNETLTPYAFYTESPEDVEDGDAPVWKKNTHVRMDLVTKITDHYHKYLDKNKRQLTKAGKFCATKSK